MWEGGGGGREREGSECVCGKGGRGECIIFSSQWPSEP